MVQLADRNLSGTYGVDRLGVPRWSSDKLEQKELIKRASNPCTIARKTHQNLTHKFSPYNITPEQWVVLNQIHINKNISQKKLADIIQKDPNNVKVLVDKLEQKSLIKKAPNPNDKRAFFYLQQIKVSSLLIL